MQPTMQETMRRAARLTRMGHAAEATRVIQAALGAGMPEREAYPAGMALALPSPNTTQEAKRETESARTPRKAFQAEVPARWRRSRPRVKVKRAERLVPVAPGARFAWHAHVEGGAARRYRLYTPAALADDASEAPLLVMLHGCTQGPDDFALGTGMNALAERHGLLVAYPEQTRGQNAMACWNWFEPGHQAREAGEPASIAGIARAIVRDHRLDGSRVFVAGLSAGGAMAEVLGRTHPDVFAAIGVHSGLPFGCASNVGGAQQAMARGGVASPAPGARPRTIVLHGAADRTVHPANGEAVFASAARRARDVRREGRATIHQARDAQGRVTAEHWEIAGLGHAWSGGDARGSHTDPSGPNASKAMLRFFLEG